MNDVHSRSYTEKLHSVTIFPDNAAWGGLQFSYLKMSNVYDRNPDFKDNPNRQHDVDDFKNVEYASEAMACTSMEVLDATAPIGWFFSFWWAGLSEYC